MQMKMVLIKLNNALIAGKSEIETTLKRRIVKALHWPGRFDGSTL
jgi:hypothetical protein